MKFPEWTTKLQRASVLAAKDIRDPVARKDFAIMLFELFRLNYWYFDKSIVAVRKTRVKSLDKIINEGRKLAAIVQAEKNKIKLFPDESASRIKILEKALDSLVIINAGFYKDQSANNFLQQQDPVIHAVTKFLLPEYGSLPMPSFVTKARTRSDRAKSQSYFIKEDILDIAAKNQLDEWLYQLSKCFQRSGTSKDKRDPHIVVALEIVAKSIPFKPQFPLTIDGIRQRIRNFEKKSKSKHIRIRKGLRAPLEHGWKNSIE